MSFAIRPLADNVVLRRANPEAMSKGGIIIAPTAQEKSLRCEVLAVGPGALNERGERNPIDVKVGDAVLVASKYAGNEVELDNEKYLLVRVNDIAGILER